MDDFDRASVLEIDERERALNAHVNRIKEPAIEYGFCNDYGHEIPAARLAVQPEAVCCVTCQEIREQREAQRGLAKH